MREVPNSLKIMPRNITRESAAADMNILHQESDPFVARLIMTLYKIAERENFKVH